MPGRKHGSGIRKPAKLSRNELIRQFEVALVRLREGSSISPVASRRRHALGLMRGSHLDIPKNRKRVNEATEVGKQATYRQLLADLETGRLDEDFVRVHVTKLFGRNFESSELENAAKRGASSHIVRQIEYLERIRDGKVPYPARRVEEATLKELKFAPGEKGLKELMDLRDSSALVTYALNLTHAVNAADRIPEEDKQTHLRRIHDFLRSMEEIQNTNSKKKNKRNRK